MIFTCELQSCTSYIFSITVAVSTNTDTTIKFYLKHYDVEVFSSEHSYNSSCMTCIVVIKTGYLKDITNSDWLFEIIRKYRYYIPLSQHTPTKFSVQKNKYLQGLKSPCNEL